MLSTDLKLINPLGLHARAASKLVDLAKTFASEVRIATDAKEVDAKSIMNILLLGAPVGTELKVIVDGEDESEALNGVCELINAGFHELD